MALFFAKIQMLILVLLVSQMPITDQQKKIKNPLACSCFVLKDDLFLEIQKNRQ